MELQHDHVELNYHDTPKANVCVCVCVLGDMEKGRAIQLHCGRYDNRETIDTHTHTLTLTHTH